MKDPQIAAIERARKEDPKLEGPLGMLAGLARIAAQKPKGRSGRIIKPDEGLLAEGFPLYDRRLLPDDVGPLWERFVRIVRIILVGDAAAAAEVIRFYEDPALFRELLSGALAQEYRFPETFTPPWPPVVLAANETLSVILIPVGEEAAQRDILRDWSSGYCPVCGALPHLSFIEGDEGRRLLSCSRCFVRWRFRRMTCPFCGEAGQKNLRYFTAEGDPIHRVYVCESCRHYLKSVDLRERPTVLARLEDLVTIRLDLVAKSEGYVRDVVDLVGLLLMSDEHQAA